MARVHYLRGSTLILACLPSPAFSWSSYPVPSPRSPSRPDGWLGPRLRDARAPRPRSSPLQLGSGRGRPPSRRHPAAGCPRLAAGRQRGAEEQSARTPTLARIPLSVIFVCLLVVYKSALDGLSRFTRMTGEPYSAITVAILVEMLQVPVLSTAVLCFEGRSRFGPVVREAVTSRPFNFAMPGLAYSVQNVLYFQALSHLSVGAYQILSQSKLLFTAFFMGVLLKRRLTRRQVLALLVLVFGTVCTQLSEVPSAPVAGSRPLYGGFLALLGALLSALPNVYYEKMVKTKGLNLWAQNMQVTFWIGFWLVVMFVLSWVHSTGSSTAAVGAAGWMTGITSWVWVLMLMQSLKCILIPATLKYGDNIMYAYAKPASIVLTVFCAAALTHTVPNLVFIIGGAMVLCSMLLYGS